MKTKTFLTLFLLSTMALFGQSPASGNLDDQTPATSLTRPSQDTILKLGQMHEEAENAVALNDFTLAAKIYTDILLIEPDDETAYTALGNIYMVTGNFKRAEDAYFNALHINPDNEIARTGLEKIRDPERE